MSRPDNIIWNIFDQTQKYFIRYINGTLVLMIPFTIHTLFRNRVHFSPVNTRSLSLLPSDGVWTSLSVLKSRVTIIGNRTPQNSTVNTRASQKRLNKATMQGIYRFNTYIQLLGQQDSIIMYNLLLSAYRWKILSAINVLYMHDFIFVFIYTLISLSNFTQNVSYLQ